MDVTYRILHNGADVACAALDGAVSWGRDDTDTQPDAATARVTFDDPNAVTAAAVTVGDRWQIVARVAGAELPRFTGTVVDVTVDHAEQRTTVTAADELAALGRRRIGDEPWPAELDGARIARILTLADVDQDARGAWADQAGAGSWAEQPPADTWLSARGVRVDPGTVTILPRDVDAQPVAALLRDTAGDAGGLVYVDRAGRIIYRDADHRVDHGEQLPVDACLLVDEAVFARGLTGMVNSLRVGYGDSTGEQQQVAVVDTDSIAAYGRFDVYRGTMLAYAADADTLARRYISFRRVPRWTAPALLVDTALLDELTPTTRGLLAATVSTELTLTGVGAPAPVPDPWPLIVEGGTDTITAGGLVVELRVSDRRQTIRGVSWAEQPAGRRWVDVPPALTWFEAEQLAA